MKRWFWHRTRVLLLALLLGVGMNLSFVGTSMMAADMAVVADSGHHGPSDCNGCGGGDHKSADSGTCLSVCGSAAQGLVSGELLTPPAASQTGFSSRIFSATTSRTSPIPVLPSSSPLADA